MGVHWNPFGRFWGFLAFSGSCREVKLVERERERRREGEKEREGGRQPGRQADRQKERS